MKHHGRMKQTVILILSEQNIEIDLTKTSHSIKQPLRTHTEGLTEEMAKVITWSMMDTIQTHYVTGKDQMTNKHCETTIIVKTMN